MSPRIRRKLLQFCACQRAARFVRLAERVLGVLEQAREQGSLDHRLDLALQVLEVDRRARIQPRCRRMASERVLATTPETQGLEQCDAADIGARVLRPAEEYSVWIGSAESVKCVTETVGERIDRPVSRRRASRGC